ncbi:MAG: glycosyltransferase family 4 protein [Bacteroidales bacterium]|nr:glycosyltransferase family 4 protein [Bacteroidales bacterium]
MIYIVLFFLLFAFQLFYFRIADRFDIIDKPTERGSHKQVTLLGGGIIFYVAVLLFFIWEGFEYPWFFLGLTLIAAISFADDVKPQSPVLRLVLQFISMFLMLYECSLCEVPWFFIPIALIFCTGILNAFNFMDGINGLTGGYGMVVMGALWYINTYQVAFVNGNLIYFLLIALTVFNFFNFRTKAKCFAGDVGAISIAFVIVFLLCLLVFKTDDLSYIVLLGVYGVDTILTIIHRIMLKENITEPHRKHLYQIMANELKIPHVVVSGIYCLIQVLISVGFIVSNHHYAYALSVIAFFCMVYTVFMKKYFHLYKQN